MTYRYFAFYPYDVEVQIISRIHEVIKYKLIDLRVSNHLKYWHILPENRHYFLVQLR